MVREEPNYPFHVAFALFAGAGLVFLTHIAKGKIGIWNYNQSQDRLVNAFTGDSVQNAIIAWGFIMVVLFSASAFPSTAPLAAAFAWLILISVVLVNADVIMKIMSNTPSLNPASKGTTG